MAQDKSIQMQDESPPESESIWSLLLQCLGNLPFIKEWRNSRFLHSDECKAAVASLEARFKEHKKLLGIPDTLEEYREKFKFAPLGRWGSCVDFCYFGLVPTEAWEFYADGTGKIFYYAGRGNSMQTFVWKEISEYTIQIEFGNWLDLDENGEVIPDEEDPDETYCVTINYDFKIIDYEGPRIVMLAIPEHETFKFHWSTEYLRFEGDIKDEGHSHQSSR